MGTEFTFEKTGTRFRASEEDLSYHGHLFPRFSDEGYDDLIPSLSLLDEIDRHVLAAVIRGRCENIVTLNRKDFPLPVLNTMERGYVDLI